MAYDTGVMLYCCFSRCLQWHVSCIYDSEYKVYFEVLLYCSSGPYPKLKAFR